MSKYKYGYLLDKNMAIIDILDKLPSDPKQAHYSDKQKYKACVLYKCTGSMTTVSDEMGIPYDTIKQWCKSDWWKELSAEISRQAKAELGGNLKKLVDLSLKEINDRLENGDWVHDQKTGKMLRRPLGAHVTNQILKDAIDRTFLIEKLARDEKVQENTEKIQDRLLKLALDFERFSKTKTIEGEVLDAVHD